VDLRPYAAPHGVPLALLGLLLFAAIVVLAASDRPCARFTETTFAAAGAMVAVYLISVQLASLHAICLWCAIGDAAFIGLAGVTAGPAGPQLQRRGIARS